MLQTMPTRQANAEKLAEIISEFVIAAKLYVAFGTKNKDPDMDMRRANGTIISFELSVAQIVEHIVTNPELAAKSRDCFFREVGFLEGLAHINRAINPHGDIFDRTLEDLKTAIRDEGFLRCVSYQHLKKKLGLPCCGLPSHSAHSNGQCPPPAPQ